ncbi:hypothetical protein ACFRCG_06950 [Embleya sp. NPDC056575]|uniref:hypothetical protein n=1 Tax=unclassified Embleya TaxID=2699296 RepID=UPI0036BFC3E4
MWAAADDARHTNAQRHLERAAHLASLSGDSPTRWRVWSHASILARERDRPAEACARTTAARRDPLYRSLGHARAACAHAALGDHRAALRTLDHTRHNLDRADPELARPSWVRFYDRPNSPGSAGSSTSPWAIRPRPRPTPTTPSPCCAPAWLDRNRRI